MNVGFVRIDDGADNYTYIAVMQIFASGISDFQYDDDYKENGEDYYEELKEKLENSQTEGS